MTFVDEVRIRVLSGNGGPGCVHFLRQAHRPKMGPDGGDGGRGGSVYFQATRNMQSLLDFRFNPTYKAQSGEKGRGTHKCGKAGEDLILKVPLGTTIYDSNTNEVLVDLVEDGVQVLLAPGGRGGLGNMNFATATRQAPDFAQPGEAGIEREVRLEIKLMADVGLLGFPNAGKSTTISKLSAARPKIADYPFTTLTPQLGVVKTKSDAFVLADIPGLIEGAHKGKGLGIKFLKHLERTRLLLVLLDPDPVNGRTLTQQYERLMEELMQFSQELAEKPKEIAINKMDAFDEEALKEQDLDGLIELVGRESIHFVSAVSGLNTEALIQALDNKLIAMGARNWKNEVSNTLTLGNQEMFRDDD
ncbi:GTPase ObgE [bacterium]|nr:GTPase ObgE [bacterium]